MRLSTGYGCYWKHLKLATTGKRFVLFQRYSALSTSTSIVKANKTGEGGKVGLISLNSKDGYNYLGQDLLAETLSVLDLYGEDKEVRAIVITGNNRVFSAGANIPELGEMDFKSCYSSDFPKFVQAFLGYKKPIIAAVNGLALGGGCELAMLCDIIYAGRTAKFALPEILLGTIPGCGGTQRLPRAIGKSKSLEMCFTGTRISGIEAQKLGLVSKVFDPKDCVEEAIKLGDRIARNSPFITMLCKDAVNKGYDMTLSSGVKYGRTLNHTTFLTKDRFEGMSAFIDKRAPKFKGS